MKKQIIYTNKDNQDFYLLENDQPKEKSNYENHLQLEIIGGNSSLYFLTAEEVDEFCELLQERKKEIWKK